MIVLSLFGVDVPDNYFKVSSNTQAYKMLGNGWQVDTIIHIFEQEINR